MEEEKRFNEKIHALLSRSTYCDVTRKAPLTSSAEDLLRCQSQRNKNGFPREQHER
jgi:hypothetical protein